MVLICLIHKHYSLLNENKLRGVPWDVTKNIRKRHVSLGQNSFLWQIRTNFRHVKHDFFKCLLSYLRVSPVVCFVSDKINWICHLYICNQQRCRLSILPLLHSVKVISGPHAIANGSAKRNGLFKNNIKTIWIFLLSIFLN